MTINNVGDALFGLILSVLVAIAAWLILKVIKLREDLIEMRGEVKALQVKVTALEASQITTECVREVIEAALEKRDKLNAERRIEWDKIRKNETEKLFRDEMIKAVPMIVHQLRETQ